MTGYIDEIGRIKKIINQIEKDTKRKPENFITYVYEIEKERVDFTRLYDSRESFGVVLDKEVYDQDYNQLTSRANEVLKKLRMGKTMESMKKRFKKGFEQNRMRRQVISHQKFYPLGFGKYRGKNLDYVMEENPSYINWALCNVEYFSISIPLYLHYLEQGLKEVPMAYRNVAVRAVIAIEVKEQEEDRYDWKE